jgi:hypothetical protein
MTDEYSIEVAQMDDVGRLGVAIKRIADRDAEIERLRAALRDFVSEAQRIERHRQSVPFYGESSESYHDLESIKDMAARASELITKRETP